MLNIFIQYFNPEILSITLANPTFGIVPADFTSLNETVRRFIIFLQITERELENIDIEESKKKDILYNYILKFEIATAPEIINFLGIELAESKFLTNKKLYREVLLKHYALNPKVIEIFNDLID